MGGFLTSKLPWRRVAGAAGVILGVAVVLLGLEGAIRGWVLLRHRGNWDIYNVWNTIYESHPHSWLRPKPNGSFRIFGGRNRVETDSHGFRSPEPDAVKAENAYRIAFLGGSTTFNTEAPSNLETIPVRVGSALGRIYPDRKIEVLNAGTAGYTTLESLTTLVSRVVPLEPDLVVVYHGVNDAVLRTSDIYREDYWRPPKPASTAFDTLLYRHSLLYRYALYRSLVGREAPRLPAERLEANRLATPPRSFERNLRSLVAVAREHGAEVVLSTFAYRPDPALEEADRWAVVFRAIDEQNAIVEAVARETGALFLDVASRMPRDPALYAGQIHRNSEGLRAHAEILVRFLVEEGVLEAARGSRATP